MVLQLWETDVALEASSNEIFAGELSINSEMENFQVKLSNTPLATVFLHSLDNKVIISKTTQNNASVILIRDIK